ncbi:MAG: dTMP kinase [Spirochaetes bacterium RBG_16_49_21]|nr:MAG: dTMP kinase [Spirochaetes bacterium RBG_16_49_21]
MRRQPLFLVFEGIDGSGKSTQADLLFRHVSSRGLSAVRLAEPTDGKWGSQIRVMLREKNMLPVLEQHKLFLMDRKDDAERNIIPALNENRIVIMDRYYYSNAAYQGALGIPPERIIRENREMQVPEPDRVYYIDIPPDIAAQRVTGRNNAQDIFERESFLKKVRGIFRSVADEKFLAIDGTKKVEEIFEIIKADFEALLGSCPPTPPGGGLP